MVRDYWIMDYGFNNIIHVLNNQYYGFMYMDNTNIHSIIHVFYMIPDMETKKRHKDHLGMIVTTHKIGDVFGMV